MVPRLGLFIHRLIPSRCSFQHESASQEECHFVSVRKQKPGGHLPMAGNLYAGNLLLDAGPAEPPMDGSRGSGSYAAGDANFDSNMVIILSALLCALICALGLKSIVRCALRCGNRLSLETTDQTATRLGTTGLGKSTLRQIPVVVYGSSGLTIPATDCPICLGEFTEGDKVRILPRCNHGFHVKCIDKWLVSRSSCPTCRQPLLEHPRSSNVDVRIP